MRRTIDPVSLRLFVAVCEERNIARAAAREAIVASAVSKRIAALEGDFGTPLLVRGRRGIEPTPAGELLLRQGRELIDQRSGCAPSWPNSPAACKAACACSPA